ncbi:hypothetical protein SAMN05421734_102254 [Pelagirhabdus alkalitolerans]|uniref:Uncharacterized protein n=1 Tax=Pelagirhabdus alkalitolerans TaxID=1612202 RepID=A0A1G6H5N1_9BACI|nr:hypothetical protein [Pelagirhabdus alkalitolerans]SDB89443.1 hypothetical protein SAMN05421734_102254 [Pelagirhabdus alkalitolerans]
MDFLPKIPESKNYWLVRTNQGKYYNDYNRNSFIGIGWNDITLDDMNSENEDDIKLLIKEFYPKTAKIGRVYNQLRIFSKVFKKNDMIVITGPSSNSFLIGEIHSDNVYSTEIEQEETEQDNAFCPYEKRWDVKWLKELHKWDVEMPMFKLLQHAQHTITDANSYKDVIQSLVSDFYAREDYGQITIRVKKEEEIPSLEFFSVGKELLELAQEFSDFSEMVRFDVRELTTRVNVNSPGNIKFKGSVKAIFIVGLILVGLNGGKFNVDLPNFMGGGQMETEMNGLLSEMSNFLNDHNSRSNSDLILQQYLKDLEVETPEELSEILNSVSHKSNE